MINSKKSIITRYILLIIFSLIAIFPMIYMLSTSLKPNGALYEFPPKFFPDKNELTLENYKYILNESKFMRNFFNSIYVSVIAVIISSIVSTGLAFVIGRFKNKFTKIIFSCLIVTMVIPGTTLIVPQFEMAVKFKIINSLSGLIPFYIAWVIPFSTFMIKGFMENIPNSIIDAAEIDGASIFQVFYKIAVPLAVPAIASVSIFNFLSSWEEFPWANTVINDTKLRTLPIAITGFFGQHQFTQWGYVFALSVLSLIPVVVIFISFQKFFISGLASGGVKG
ncbi:MAG: carbohydrate ABC transporter permease [Sphaerochaetaceae bacterium]|nr:carbohydrate ABC transporter permease [Sphaerochaetaceae bacterium]